jgi:uncharacterized protein (DUF433 family)
MATQEGKRIVSTPDVLGGDPRIEGRRISVYFIHERVEGRGLSPQTVADRHDLDVADVYRALAYYHEHPQEMAEIQLRRQRHLDEAAGDPTVATGPDDLGESPSE